MTSSYTIDDLEAFAENLLTHEGADREEARIISSALVWSDAIGRPTHGLWRLPTYLERFRLGLIRSPCRPTVSHAAPALAIVDGDNGFGHYVGHVAMCAAMSAASEVGVGLAVVSNSNHFGAGAYFVKLAADARMLGVATSNSVARLAPFGGVRPVFGTNPMAFAVPRSDAPPVIFDMATAAVSGASLITAAENQETIPEGLVVDWQGTPITDPALCNEGAMLPFGGAKGAGIALLVEVLAGVISGASLSRDVRSMFADFSGNSDVGHCFIAIDIGRLIDFDCYSRRLEDLLGEIIVSGPEGGSPVRLPGDARWSALREADSGIVLTPSTLRGLEELAERARIAFPPSKAS